MCAPIEVGGGYVDCAHGRYPVPAPATQEILKGAVLTYGGVETAQYPLAIYQPGFRRFFTFVVPLGCISYFPAVAILGIEDPLGSELWMQVAAPLAGYLFFAVSLLAWRFGIRHYTSTGS